MHPLSPRSKDIDWFMMGVGQSYRDNDVTGTYVDVYKRQVKNQYGANSLFSKDLTPIHSISISHPGRHTGAYTNTLGVSGKRSSYIPLTCLLYTSQRFSIHILIYRTEKLRLLDTTIFIHHKLDLSLIHISPIRRGISTMKGYVFVGEKVVCEAEFMAQIVKNK